MTQRQLHRHGSRGPVFEQDDILKLVDTLDKARDIIQAAHLPPYLEFLKEGYKYQLVPEELTIVGRKELFEHGIEFVHLCPNQGCMHDLQICRFALRYPTFSTDDVVSTTVQRVIDSARFFSQGLFGRGADDIDYWTTDDFEDPVSWLVPWESCPKLSFIEAQQVNFIVRLICPVALLMVVYVQEAQKWTARYIPPIVKRLNKLVPGVGFSPDDIHGALYACPYDHAAGNRSPWCNVFKSHELRGLE